MFRPVQLGPLQVQDHTDTCIWKETSDCWQREFLGLGENETLLYTCRKGEACSYAKRDTLAFLHILIPRGAASSGPQKFYTATWVKGMCFCLEPLGRLSLLLSMGPGTKYRFHLALSSGASMSAFLVISILTAQM